MRWQQKEAVNGTGIASWTVITGGAGMLKYPGGWVKPHMWRGNFGLYSKKPPGRGAGWGPIPGRMKLVCVTTVTGQNGKNTW